MPLADTIMDIFASHPLVICFAAVVLVMGILLVWAVLSEPKRISDDVMMQVVGDAPHIEGRG